jgi:hypothetical protein
MRGPKAGSFRLGLGESAESEGLKSRFSGKCSKTLAQLFIYAQGGHAQGGHAQGGDARGSGLRRLQRLQRLQRLGWLGGPGRAGFISKKALG